MLCALLVFEGPGFPAPLDQLSPWVDATNRPLDEVFATLAAQRHRRFVKAHTPLDGIPWDDDVIYVVVGRDPRDVAVSYHHHRARIDYDQFLEQRAVALGDGDDIGPPRSIPRLDTATDTFQWFLDATDAIAPAPSLRNVLHHFDTAWQRRGAANVGRFHFSDYQADLVGELRRLAQLLDIPVTQRRAAELAEMSGIDRMRADAARFAPGAAAGFWSDPAVFFRSGGSAQWQTIATPDQLTQYDALVESLVPLELAEWAHHGRRGCDPAAGGGGC
jgi:Sulfotransferase domain